MEEHNLTVEKMPCIGFELMRDAGFYQSFSAASLAVNSRLTMGIFKSLLQSGNFWVLIK
jgi:hypothetical protein